MAARESRGRSNPVDRAMVRLVGLVVDETWTASTAAVELRRSVADEAVLRRARARIWRALAERAGIFGERAAATLDAALALGRPEAGASEARDRAQVGQVAGRAAT